MTMKQIQIGRSLATHGVQGSKSVTQHPSGCWASNNCSRRQAVSNGAFRRTSSVASHHVMPEHENDAVQIEALLDRAFGKARHRKTVQKMRKRYLPSDGLAFVMLSDFGDVIGTIRLWDVEANGARALLLGPVAIAPEYQGQGLGDALIRHSLAQAQKLGHRGVVLVGDAPYYARFGFTRGLTLDMKLPGPVDEARFLGLELATSGLGNVKGLLNISGTLRPKSQLKRKAA